MAIKPKCRILFVLKCLWENTDEDFENRKNK